jgi:hypothetical protein
MAECGGGRSRELVDIWPLPFLEHWLARAGAPEPAALIFVLAGREDRKLHALKLYQQGCAPRLIISVGRFEIRRFEKLPLPVQLPLRETAAAIPAAKRHFFVCFEGDLAEIEAIPARRLGTLREIQALENWLIRRPEITSVLVITNGVHARRVRLCCQAVLDRRIQVHLTNAPNPSEDGQRPRDGIWKELVKLSAYWVWLVLALGRTRRTQ